MIVKAQDDVLSLSGSLTENHWLTIKAAANLLLHTHPEGIIIDCSGLTRCTPEGAHTFSEAASYIERHQARIILVNLPPEILETLQSVPGVRSIISTSRSMEEARASLKLGTLSRGPAGKSCPVIMLPLLRGGDPTAAIHQAAALSKERGGKLYVVYVLEVPRALALTAPLAEQEQSAQAALERAISLARREGLAAEPYLQRGRDFSQSQIEAAQKIQADVIVLGLPPGDHGDGGYGAVVDTLLRRAPCEVLINKGAPAAASKPAAAAPSANRDRDTERLGEA